MKVRDVIKRLNDDGWNQVGQTGSHRQFKHPTKTGRVTVAGHLNLDLQLGTLKSVANQAGLVLPGLQPPSDIKDPHNGGDLA